jgi:hypothetical protein
MAHRFDPQQQIDGQGRLHQARGPVDTGQNMFWILALIWQNRGGGNYAAAWGTGNWQNGTAPKWHCQTTMVGSNRFVKGPARAWALARVTDGGGMFFPWGDNVTLV